MAKKGHELPIIQKAFELALYMTPMVERMPRAHKFTLGERLVNHTYDLLEKLTMARFTKNRLALLREANLLLERMRMLLRLASRIKAVAIKSYGQACEIIEEVGAMLGGWIRACTARR